MIAIGNPFGVGTSVTLGIISGLNRNIGPPVNYLQTDTPINTGNSGGPLFNASGEVVGINTAIFSPSGGSVGIGFATPSNLASVVVDELRTYGRVREKWLGIAAQGASGDDPSATEEEESLGVLVKSVGAQSPAKEAGMKPGDSIVSFNGQTVRSTRDFKAALFSVRIGETVNITVLRNSQEKILRVEMKARPERPAQ